MTIGISKHNSELLDQFIDTILQSFEDRTIEQTEARESLKKAFSLVASDNQSVGFFLESEIRAILDQGGRG
jgi:hypothetical protein